MSAAATGKKEFGIDDENNNTGEAVQAEDMIPLSIDAAIILEDEMGNTVTEDEQFHDLSEWPLGGERAIRSLI